MQAVYIVNKVSIAKVLIDPMRRAILNLLREQPMTQAQLAEELGLSNASLNYHMKILHEHKLVNITGSVAEEHGIIQKFFSSAAFLFVYDLDAMPKDVARYFYPISLERARTLISTLTAEGSSSGYSLSSLKRVLREKDVEEISSSLSQLLLLVAKQYTGRKASYGEEKIVYDIYTKAFNLFLSQNLQKSVRIKF